MWRFGMVMVVAVVWASGGAAAEKAKPAEKAKAAEKAKPADGDAKAEAEDAAGGTEEITVPHIKGPKLVDLGNQIELDLPEGYVLFERAQAIEMIRKGGGTGEHALGIVVRPDRNWSAVIEHVDIGYVSDSDADQLDAGELLESYRSGTVEQNRRRKELGVPELIIDGWSETPRYERTQHHLVWGLKGHDTDGPVINFFTRILGREGYLSVNLIDEPSAIEQAKTEALPLLTATRFKSGARYEDYREGDRSSGLGLKALVLGGAGIATAKVVKTGVLVSILIALKKLFIFIAVGIGGFFKWLLGRGRRNQIAREPAHDLGLDPSHTGEPPAPPTPPAE